MSTNNNNQTARSYQKQFKDFLQAVFRTQAYFGDFFGGGIEVLDGVQHNATAFSLKTSDIPVVVGDKYITDPNVGFGTGTSNSSRFGERKEIIYTDTDVPYTWGWRYHEGIDRFTVNNAMESAIADRLDLQAQAKMKQFNEAHSKFIASVAGYTKQLTGYTNDAILALFNDLSKYFLNIEAVGTKVAKVNAELYNAIVDHPLMTSGKHSAVNIDNNNLPMFKGFVIQQVPDAQLQGNNVAYAYITNVGRAFTGINTARAIESEDFDGVALQGAGKAGEFILDDNKKAVVKVNKDNTPEG
ncbi:phage capsid protein [Paenibacillus sp. 79R4]|uniref:phage capsid protein n=1 Tax=Paenibacillus sp. 79R4 TaxID=2212847 RepID=UPI0015BD99B7|nr:phage capsid protein [Paenibacillus sp. 79R4]NWL87559.1 phage capsid protein [Paenibacillus sp. 79R4]